MANYDRDALQAMCDKIDLLDYASQSLDFRKHGEDSYAAHCPLHVDKTPSLTITPSKNLFHCFSCGRGGSLIQWLMYFEHMSFHDAIEKVSALSGMDVKQLKQCSAMAYYKDMKRSNDMYQPTQLTRTCLDFARDYTNKYASDLPQEWLDEGISKETMHKFNIRIDDNANRIVYPIYDNDFNFIGVKGRTRFENYKVLKLPKYMNYHKIQTTNFFVGMKENHDAIKNRNEIIIVEGIKSVMKLYDFGYDWCVASETSCLNDDQIRILVSLGVKNVVIAYDNDIEISKTLRCVQMLRKFVNVYVVRDTGGLLNGEKMSPCDRGKDVWDKLYNERKRI